jgi:c-di-GMP-binding flagellar brake protein YcgR
MNRPYNVGWRANAARPPGIHLAIGCGFCYSLLVQDKRRHPRFSVEGLQGMVMFTTPVEVVNMSMGGAAVRADMRLNIGREYVLRLDVDGQGLSVKGIVVWSTLSGIRRNEQGESVSQYSAGLKFRDVVTDEIEKLLGFIDDNKVNPEKRLSGLRFRVQTPGRAVLDAAQGYEVLLISLSGMLIRTEQDLALEGVHPMEIIPAGESAIRFTGRVASTVEVQEDGPTFHEIGIEFLEMSANDRARLDAFVATLSQ